MLRAAEQAVWTRRQEARLVPVGANFSGETPSDPAYPVAADALQFSPCPRPPSRWRQKKTRRNFHRSRENLSSRGCREATRWRSSDLKVLDMRDVKQAMTLCKEGPTIYCPVCEKRSTSLGLAPANPDGPLTKLSIQLGLAKNMQGWPMRLPDLPLLNTTSFRPSSRTHQEVGRG